MGGRPSSLGPLVGVRVIELAGLGPGPFAAMVLSDLGADVVRIERAGASGPRARDVVSRGRRIVALDLKNADDCSKARDLIARADVLIEGFRPGVMERLGLGPDECARANPGLIYGRMTGWGRSGPQHDAAGHDINYIALAGALAHLPGTDGRPAPPLNLIGDYGGGALYLVVGVLAALVERQRSGLGQEVDAAMVDGAASLMASFWGFRGVEDTIGGVDEKSPGTRMLDGGAPYYCVYECADGAYVSIGAIEPKFYAELVGRLGLDGDPLFAPARQNDRASWARQREKLAELFRAKAQRDWCSLLEGTDSCFAPVLTMTQALAHPHNAQRGTFVEVDGIAQPAPAPRFGRTPPAPPTPSESWTAADVAATWSEPDPGSAR